MSNAFLSYAVEAIPVPVQRQQARLQGKPHAGGVLALSPLEEKMREKQRLSRAFRAWRRSEVKATLASEPRLRDFLKYLRTVDETRGSELLEAVAACEWLRRAPLSVRVFALRMISARCDRINQRLGNEALDDPIPPETSLYFEAKSLLHEGGRA